MALAGACFGTVRQGGAPGKTVSMINKLERKFGRYAIKGLMKYLMLLYGLGLLLAFISPEFYDNWLALDIEMTFGHFQLWRLVTFLIQPIEYNNIFFVLIAMYLYYFIGNMLEMKWGSFRFNAFFFIGMLFSAVTGCFTGIADNEFIFTSIFLAFAMESTNTVWCEIKGAAQKMMGKGVWGRKWHLTSALNFKRQREDISS